MGNESNEATVFVFTAGEPNEGGSVVGVYSDLAVAVAAVREYAVKNPCDHVDCMGFAPGKGGNMVETGWVAWGRDGKVQTF